MKYLLSLIALCTVTVLYAQEPYKEYTEASFSSGDSTIACEGFVKNDLKVGVWKYYTAWEGKLYCEGAYIDGKRDGKWTLYQDGKIEKIQHWNKGNAQGEWTEYYKDGKIKNTGLVEPKLNAAKASTKPGDEGKKCLPSLDECSGKVEVGLWKYYHPNGKLEAEGHYDLGLQVNTWAFYFQGGQKEVEGIFIKGKKSGEWKAYHENGVLLSIGKYVDNEPDGEWKVYDNAGIVQEIRNYKLGKFHGTYTSFYESSNTKAKGNFVEGNQDGSWEYYYESGKLACSRIFKNGMKQGVWTGFYENGKTQYTENYNDGWRIGKKETFYENGNKESVQFYRVVENSDKKPTITKILRLEEQLFSDQKKADNRNEIRDKVWEYYDENGKLQLTEFYKDGELEKSKSR